MVSLTSELDRLCGRNNWVTLGSSALLFDDAYVYLEINKPRYWHFLHGGEMAITLGAIGGHLEKGEDALACLLREVREEIRSPVRVMGTRNTYLIWDGEYRGDYGWEGAPRPWFCTVARHQNAKSRFQYASIVTFLARVLDRPQPDDLYGLVAIPRGQLGTLLAECPAPLGGIFEKTKTRLMLNGTLPADAWLEPILTARSLSCLPDNELEKMKF